MNRRDLLQAVIAAPLSKALFSAPVAEALVAEASELGTWLGRNKSEQTVAQIWKRGTESYEQSEDFFLPFEGDSTHEIIHLQGSKLEVDYLRHAVRFNSPRT